MITTHSHNETVL